jgi:hypothetical protein
MYQDAFFSSLDNLFGGGGHVFSGLQAGDLHRVGPQPPRYPGAIEGDAAAAQHDDFLTDCGPGSRVDLSQKIDAEESGVIISARERQPLPPVGAHRDQDSIKTLPEQLIY